jgi:HD-like signal output (HDOD) protein
MSPALTGVPPFHAVAIKSLQFISHESGQLRALSELIATDAALSGEILRVVNSPLLSMRKEISSILEAIVLLGIEHVKGIVMTIATRSYLGDSLEIPAIKACWRHSLACAILAKNLAPSNFIEPEVAYTAGLIHDIGRLALVASYPKEYADFLTSAETEPYDAIEREREVFGIDHCEAGGQLVAYWKLPKMFLAVTSQHHDAAEADEPGLLSAVRHSCMLADALGFNVVHTLHPRNYNEILKELPERERDKFPIEPTEAVHDIASRINAIESA